MRSSLSYRLPRILFFTLFSLFLYTLFVFLTLYVGAVGYSLFGVLFFSVSTATALVFQVDGSDGEEIEKPMQTVYAPISGKIIPLSEVADEVFAEGIMGDGCAVIPNDERLYAPISGLIIAFSESVHAITLLGDDGAELLMQIGKDTDRLKGRHFTAYKKVGERVRRGEILLSFERERLSEMGYDLTVPITLANSLKYEPILPLCGSVIAGDPIFTLKKR